MTKVFIMFTQKTV